MQLHDYPALAGGQGSDDGADDSHGHGSHAAGGH
jgi:hypothetical protein